MDLVRIYMNINAYDILSIIQFVNSKGADQTARMRKLVCALVVCRP